MDEGDLPELNPGNKHFFIQAMDGESGLALCESYIGQFSPNKVAAVLNFDLTNIGINEPIYVDEEKLRNICFILNLGKDNAIDLFFGENRPANTDLGIFMWTPQGRNLPYRLHTGRELLLMKDGSKPLSAFSGRIPADESFTEIPEHIFDVYVHQQYFLKKEIIELEALPVCGIRGHRIVLYAIKGEEWRLESYALIRDLARKIGWSEPLIRLEGSLLGYRDWQNDAYIEQMNNNRSFAK